MLLDGRGGGVEWSVGRSVQGMCKNWGSQQKTGEMLGETGDVCLFGLFLVGGWIVGKNTTINHYRTAFFKGFKLAEAVFTVKSGLNNLQKRWIKTAINLPLKPNAAKIAAGRNAKAQIEPPQKVMVLPTGPWDKGKIV